MRIREWKQPVIHRGPVESCELPMSGRATPSLGRSGAQGLPPSTPPPRSLHVNPSENRKQKFRLGRRIIGDAEQNLKRKKRVWQSRTLLPDLPGELVVPPSNSLALRGPVLWVCVIRNCEAGLDHGTF